MDESHPEGSHPGAREERKHLAKGSGKGAGREDGKNGRGSTNSACPGPGSTLATGWGWGTRHGWNKSPQYLTHEGLGETAFLGRKGLFWEKDISHWTQTGVSTKRACLTALWWE